MEEGGGGGGGEADEHRDSGQTLQLYKLCIRMQKKKKKSHIRTLKILQFMSEFGGLRKHENSPACTKSVKVHNVEVGHYERRTKTGLYICEDQSSPAADCFQLKSNKQQLHLLHAVDVES